MAKDLRLERLPLAGRRRLFELLYAIAGEKQELYISTLADTFAELRRRNNKCKHDGDSFLQLICEKCGSVIE